MEHLAIDLGGKESQICVRASDGTIVEERRWKTAALKGYLRGRPKSRVVVETCAESFGVADAALELGHEVRVVPASLVRSLGVGARRTKTDRRDAQTLSEVSCRIDLPSVHIPAKESRRRKSVCGMREELVNSRTGLINTVRGWLRAEARRVPGSNAETFPQRLRETLQREGVELPKYVERQLVAIDSLSAVINEADQELAELAASDPVCVRLQTVPGVGPVTSVRFAAAIDDVSRFPDAHSVESYLGLVAGEDSSSERTRRTGITKAGPPALRRALVQGAWVARRWRKGDPMVLWSMEVEKRRGKPIAVVALARKMAGILFAIWRDGTVYDASRGAKAQKESASASAG